MLFTTYLNNLVRSSQTPAKIEASTPDKTSTRPMRPA